VDRNAIPEAGILERIVATKRAEVAALAARRMALVRAAERAPAARPFAAALRQDGRVAVIGEFKRRSPSAGGIAEARDPAGSARAYAAGGASALSVLTDHAYFGGSLADLQAARAACELPVLRKDFTTDALQVFEARAAGADAVLLIVRLLDAARLREYVGLAAALGLAALVEVHDAAELERALAAGADLVGINNRDLATFRTDLGVSLELAARVPAEATLVAESGIACASDVARLGAAGVDAVLVGESLMRSRDSSRLVHEFATQARVPR
jgi:indole-3-glycerol phosphate synthase